MADPNERIYGPSPDAKARLDEIFNQLIPSLRQRGVIPSEPYKPLLPPVIPGLPYSFRPGTDFSLSGLRDLSGQEGLHLRQPTLPGRIVPPEPVDWSSSLGTMGKGLLAGTSTIPAAMGAPFLGGFRDFLRGGTIEELTGREDPSMLDRVLTSPEMKGFEEFWKRFSDPLIDYSKQRIHPLAHDPNAEWMRQQLRDRGYGPLESAQAAYSQADVDPVKDIAYDVGADPFNFALAPLEVGIGAKFARGIPKFTRTAGSTLPDGTVIDRLGQVVSGTGPRRGAGYTPEGRPIFVRPETTPRFDTEFGDLLPSYREQFVPPRPPEIPKAAQAIPETAAIPEPRQLELGETAGIPTREGEQLAFPMRTSMLDEVPVDETLGPRVIPQVDEVVSARQQLETLVNDVIVTSPVKTEKAKFNALKIVRDKYVKEVLDETRPAIAGDPTKPRLSSRDYKTAVRYTAMHTGKTEQEIDDLFQRVLAEGLAERSQLARTRGDLTRRLPPEIQASVRNQIDRIFEPEDIAGYRRPQQEPGYTPEGRPIFRGAVDIPETVVDPEQAMVEVQEAVDNLITLRQQGKHLAKVPSSRTAVDDILGVPIDPQYRAYYEELRNILATKLDMAPEQIDDYIDTMSQGTLPGFEPSEILTLAERNAFEPTLFDMRKTLTKAEYEAFHKIKYPKAEEMTREQYLQFMKDTQSTEVVAAIDAATSPSNRGAILKSIKDPSSLIEYKAGFSKLADVIKARIFEPISRNYLIWRMAADDGTLWTRALMDYFDSINPNSFQFGSDTDLLVIMQLMEGQAGQGAKRYDLFMKIEILPLLGIKTVRNNVAVVNKEVNQLMQWHISRYVQAKHWANMLVKPDGTPNMPNRDLPRPIDPRKWDENPDIALEDKIKAAQVADVVNADGTYKEMSEWIPDMQSTLTPEQFADVEKGATAIADLYSKERGRLINSGYITKEVGEELARDYPWYNPTVYAEYLNKSRAGSGVSNSIFGNTENVIKSFKDDAPQLGAMDPLDPEVMARKLVENERKLQQNRVGKAFHYWATRPDKDGEPVDWIHEVTQQFQTKKKQEVIDPLTGKVKIDSQGKKVIEEITVNTPIPRNVDKKAGYLIFWENGQRRVFGTKGNNVSITDQTTNLTSRFENVLDPDVFDWLYGMSGLTTRPAHEVDSWFRMAGGFMRSLRTNFNIKFVTANPVIDMFNIWIRYGIAPPSVVKRMSTNLFSENGIVRQGEDYTYLAYQMVGADKTRTGTMGKYARGIEEQLKADGIAGELVWADAPVTGQKWRRAMQDFTDENVFLGGVKRVGKALELGPRLEIFERAIKGELGTDEWARLKSLDERDFMDELIYNYKGTPGKGLVEHPAMRKAGALGLDATLDFWRGGNWIRKVNPYTYFLNATMESMKLPFRSMGIDISPTFTIDTKATGTDPKIIMGKWGGWKGKTPTGTRFRDIDVAKPEYGLFGDTQARAVEAIGDVVGGVRSRIAESTGLFPALPGKGTSAKFQGNYRKAAFALGGVMVTQMSLTAWNLSHAEAWGYWNIPWYYKYSGFLLLLKPKTDPETGKFERDDQGRIKPRFILFPHRTREWTIGSSTVWFMEKFVQEMQEPEEVIDPTTGQPMLDENGEPILRKPDKARLNNFFKVLLSNQSPISDNPVTDLPSTGFGMVPGLAEGYDELRGRDHWKDEPIVPHWLAEQPVDEQVLPSTSYLSVGLSKIMNEGNTYESPARMDYLLKNTFGGIETPMGAADWIIEGLKELHSLWTKSEPTTAEQRVEKYRNIKGDEFQTAGQKKDEFETSIMRKSEKEYKEFRKELRKPNVEMSSILGLDTIVDRYVPPNASGGMGILTQQIQEEEYGRSIIENQQRMNARLSKTRDSNRVEQRKDDTDLLAWSERPPGDTLTGINPYEWRNNNSKRSGKYAYLKQETAGIYGDDVFSMSPEEQDKFYGKVFELGGKMGKDNMGLLNEWLLSNYFLINFPEDGTPIQEQQFYDAREDFVSSLIGYYGAESAVYRNFDDSLQKNMTAQQAKYAEERQIMAPYWDIGTNVDEFTQGKTPEQKNLWSQWILGDTETRKTLETFPIIQTFLAKQQFLRNKHVEDLFEKDKASGWITNLGEMLDTALTFHWGRNYKPVMRDNIQLRNKLYGVDAGAAAPRLQQPVLP